MQNVIWWLLIVFLIFTMLRKRFFMFNNKDVKNLSAEEAYRLISENNDIIVLDVRTINEFESGHIPKAKNIPVQQLSSRMKELEKYKETPILVHCASGGRSPSAVNALINNNFTQIYHLNTGLMSWKHSLIR